MKPEDQVSCSDVWDALDSLPGGNDEFAEYFLETAIRNSVFLEDGKVERITAGMDAGFGVRMIRGGLTSFGYSDRLNREEMIRLGREVSRNGDAAVGGVDRKSPLRERSGPPPEVPAEEVTTGEKTALVTAADEEARSVSGEISQVRVAMMDSVREVGVYNNRGVAVREERRQILFMIRVIAANGSELQTAVRKTGGNCGFELFQGVDTVVLAHQAARAAVRILHARPAPAGRMPVVVSGEAGGTLIHEAIGHGLEGDAVEKGLSAFSGKLGKQVASPLITVIDDSTLEDKRGSYRFDDEGERGRRNILVEDGILRGYLLDRVTAEKMGAQSSGSGRRESYRFRPIVRMSNTMIAPGEHDPGEIIASVDEGLLVRKIGGGQVDTVSGDFVFGVNEAYLIKGGKVGEAVRGATLIGNGPGVLRSIDMVGDDPDFDIGTCGKDGQRVPVADAQPTLRIPAITVGGMVE